MTQILIYQDYVHNNGGLLAALIKHYGRESVGFADANDVLNGILSDRITAFFMPGGASRYVSDKLNGKGNQLIKDYVANGGLYVGICAGAYYACRRIEWRAGQPDQICVDNELGFFPGVAKGPIAELIDGEDMASVTSLVTNDGAQIKTFYWAGPFFESNESSYQILARYEELAGQPAAIVTGEFGKGRYLLLSPHLEITSEQMGQMNFNVPNNKYADIAKINNESDITLDYFYSVIEKFLN